MISATLDSNVYISALQFGGSGTRMLNMARAGVIRLDTSDAILSETIGVLRDKFGWEPYRLHFGRLELEKITNKVQPSAALDVADDADDNRILECAVEAGSDYIVTWDQDLLRLVEYAGIGILTPEKFTAAKKRES